MSYFPPKPIETINRIAYKPKTAERYRFPSPAYLERINGDRVRFIDSDGFRHDVRNPSITFNQEVARLRDNPGLYEIVQEE